VDNEDCFHVKLSEKLFFWRVHASSHPTQFNFNNINSQPEFSISKNHFLNKSHSSQRWWPHHPFYPTDRPTNRQTKVDASKMTENTRQVRPT